MKNSNKGLTLIELLVVVLIVAILAAVAIPVYTGYMQRARRADAKTALEQVRAAQEMWRAERGSYATDAGGNTAETILQNTMGASATAISLDYTWVFTNKTATAFTAQATPISARQLSDGWLMIDNNGVKTDQDGKVWPEGKWAK
jgi:type IV pilus assembly protein PilE